MNPYRKPFVLTPETLRSLQLRRRSSWTGPRWRNNTPPINPQLYLPATAVGTDMPYWDLAANKGAVYSACNQAAVTFGAGLSSTVATFVVYNPPGTAKNLALLQASFAFSAAPAAATVVALVGGSGAALTGVTAITLQSGMLGGAVTGAVGKAASAATLPGTPVYLLPLVSVTAASGITPENAIFDLKGSIVLPPGAFVAFQASAAAVGFCGVVWAEF